MVKAIVVTCPHCGARLNVQGDRREVRCEYCETQARIQRRTQFFERALPPPADGPKPVALQRHTKVFIWVMILTTVIPVLLVPLFIFMGVRSSEQKSADLQKQIQSDLEKQLNQAGLHMKMPLQAPGADDPEWQGTDAVLLVDVDGNGSKEIVGRTRRVQKGDQIRVIAIEGATGKPIWESEALGTYTDTYQGRLSIVGDTVVFGSPRGDVKAFALATGKPKWSAKIDERVKYFCDGSNGLLHVVGNDNVIRPLKLADGTATTLEQPPPPADKRRRKAPCVALASDADAIARDPTATWELGKALDMNIDRLHDGPAGRVAAGTRATGTGIGTLALLDPSAPVGGEPAPPKQPAGGKGSAAAIGPAKWKVVVPTDALAAVERAPEPVAVGAAKVCAAYYTESVAKPKRLACFAAGDGARLWDVDSGSTWSLEGMYINNRALLTWSHGSLQLRALDNGNVIWSFGRS